MRSRGAALMLAGAIMVLLSGCAGVSAPGAQASTSPTPTVACPQVEGQPLPPECAPYDPEKALAQNDVYRERTEMPEQGRAAAEETIAALRPELEKLHDADEMSPDVVGKALAGVGLDGIEVLGDARGTEFSANGPEGGCIFGVVSHDQFTVEMGGHVNDGGCFTPR